MSSSLCVPVVVLVEPVPVDVPVPVVELVEPVPVDVPPVLVLSELSSVSVSDSVVEELEVLDELVPCADSLLAERIEPAPCSQ